MVESHSGPPPGTVLVPAAGDMPAVTQADVERMLTALFEVEGKTGDLCVTAAAMIALMARRIHHLDATAAPTAH